MNKEITLDELNDILQKCYDFEDRSEPLTLDGNFKALNAFQAETRPMVSRLFETKSTLYHARLLNDTNTPDAWELYIEAIATRLGLL